MVLWGVALRSPVGCHEGMPSVFLHERIIRDPVGSARPPERRRILYERIRMRFGISARTIYSRPVDAPPSSTLCLLHERIQHGAITRFTCQAHSPELHERFMGVRPMAKTNPNFLLRSLHERIQINLLRGIRKGARCVPFAFANVTNLHERFRASVKPRPGLSISWRLRARRRPAWPWPWC